MLLLRANPCRVIRPLTIIFDSILVMVISSGDLLLIVVMIVDSLVNSAFEPKHNMYDRFDPQHRPPSNAIRLINNSIQIDHNQIRCSFVQLIHL